MIGRSLTELNGIETIWLNFDLDEVLANLVTKMHFAHSEGHLLTDARKEKWGYLDFVSCKYLKTVGFKQNDLLANA